MTGSEANLTPTLAEVQRATVANALQYVHTAVPGIVQSFDAATKTAEITVALQRPRLLSDGTYEMENIGTLSNVPVAFPRGGGFFLDFPLVKGDGVLVIFTMYAHDAWRQTGEVSPPGDNRVHSVAGAVALAGFDTAATASAHPATGHLVFGKDGGPTIHVDTLIKLGSNGTTDFVALATRVAACFAALKSAVAAWTPVPNDGGASLKAVVAAITFASTAATKVQAE